MRKDARAIVFDLSALLATGQEALAVASAREALSSSDAGFEAFLVSNELWGGSGSIADQVLISDPAARAKLEGLLIELGTLQMEAGKTNVRTATWIAAFENWRQSSRRQY